MKYRPSLPFLLSTVVLLGSCSGPAIRIGENTFLKSNKIYKVIDNNVVQIGDLGSDTIMRISDIAPKLHDLGQATLSFIKPGANTTLKTLYRGNTLYYTLKITGLNDLKDKYAPGEISIQLYDNYGFIVQSIDIPTNLIIRVIDDKGNVDHVEYSGKTDVSTDINSAIKSYDVTSNIKIY